MTVLETRELKKYYGTGENRVCALNGINLKVEQGEFLTIVGSSGSGKSTLLHMLGGLDRPSEGSVVVDGKDLFSMKEEALTIFRRRKIGFVFQAYNLVPVLNVWENIILPVQLDGAKVPLSLFVWTGHILFQKGKRIGEKLWQNRNEIIMKYWGWTKTQTMPPLKRHTVF